MRNKSFFLYTLLFFMACPLVAQVDLSQLSRRIERERQAWNVPGMAVAIVKDGEVVMASGFGSLESGKPGSVNEETLFAIASNTKAFVATALGMLVEEGKLNWDDPVQQYLPEFTLTDACASAMITIKDLLCHRAGLGTFSGDVIWYKSDYPASEVVRRISEVPLEFGFRDGYGYSNLMFITAGEVIRAVTGQSWAAFVETRLLQPLGMNRTVTSVTDLEGMTNVAQPHKPEGAQNTPIQWVNWDNMGAAGGIISSVSDLTKWLMLQLNGGESGDDTFFRPSTQELLWTPLNAFSVSARSKELFPGRQFSGYGLGWSLSDYQGRLTVSHGGGYDGMYSRVLLVPEEQLGIVILTNSMKGIATWLGYHILDQFFDHQVRDWMAYGLSRQQQSDQQRSEQIRQLIEARETGTSPAFDETDCLGKYLCPMYGTVNILMKDGRLRLDFPHAPNLSAALSHWHHNTYRIEWDTTHAWFDFGTLQFVTDHEGDIVELRFDVPNEDIFFHEINAKRLSE